MDVKVTAFVLTVGEQSTSDCIKRLEAQDLPIKIDVLRNYAPTNIALQKMIERCTTPYFMQVDADMLLEPHAAEYLLACIREAGDNCAMYYGWMWGDAEDRPIGQVKIYRHSIVKDFPFNAVPASDGDQKLRLLHSGFEVVADKVPEGREDPRCLGLHFALQSEESAYARWFKLSQRLRIYPKNLQWVRPYYVKLWQDAAENPGDPIKLACFLGAIAGMAAALPTGEDDYRESLPGYHAIYDQGLL